MNLKFKYLNQFFRIQNQLKIRYQINRNLNYQTNRFIFLKYAATVVQIISNLLSSGVNQF